MIAHVAGLPIEELLPAAAVAGSALLLARSRLAMRLRRAKQITDDTAPLGDG